MSPPENIQLFDMRPEKKEKDIIITGVSEDIKGKLKRRKTLV